MGHFHPETIIDNPFLESLNIETNHQWIMDRVGILTRRTVLPLEYIFETHNRDVTKAKKVARYTASDLGVQAAKMALERAQILPNEVQLVVAGGCLPEMSIPTQAALISAKLGIEAPCFDINAACSSFIAQIDCLEKMRPETLPDYILVVIPETVTMSTSYDDRTVAVLLGDGAAAAILSPRIQGKASIQNTVFGSKPSGYDKVGIPYGGHFTQQGQAVQRFAILQTQATTMDLLNKTQIDPSNTYFIGHQANLRMLESTIERMGISKDKHLYNVDAYGNQCASGAPIVLSQHWDTFKPNDWLALTVVGSGLAWGGMVVKFT